jgi:hypothetical protein
MAERQGFEPWVPIGYNGFRDRPNRPLWHLSAGRGLIGGAGGDCNHTFILPCSKIRIKFGLS